MNIAGLRSQSASTRLRSFRKACAVLCACLPARLMHWIQAIFQSPLWEKPEQPMTSGMRSSWAPLTALKESRSPCASALTTTVPWDAKETGGKVALPVFKEIMLSVYRKMLAGPVPAFPDQMEQSINNYLNGDPVEDVPTPEKNIPQNIEAPPNTEAKRITPNHAAAVSF